MKSEHAKRVEKAMRAIEAELERAPKLVRRVLREKIWRLALEYQRRQKELEEDYLTKGLNREGIEYMLARTVDQCRANGWTLAVADIDIDNFKGVNDQYGHDIGDQVITQVGNAFRKITRAGDILGRQGGDEFRLILQEVNMAQAENILERVARKFGEMTKDVNGGVTMSIACVVYNGESVVNKGYLLRQLDAKLYDVKESGKNGILVAEYNHNGELSKV